jgi:hypothetical protein
MPRSPSAALKLRTITEVYKDGSRKIFHRTRKLVLSHGEDELARALCEVCAEQSGGDAGQLPAGPSVDGSRVRPHKLDDEAAALFAATADPSEFDKLRRQGWPGTTVPGSQLLLPCGQECTICHPTAESNAAAWRRARKGKR